MNLIKEKEKLMQLACKEKSSRKFSSLEQDCSTYYLPYADSKHFNATLSVYDSTDFAGLKHDLIKLWENDPVKKEIVPIIQVGIRKTLAGPERKLGDIDLYNYMM